MTWPVMQITGELGGISSSLWLGCSVSMLQEGSALVDTAVAWELGLVAAVAWVSAVEAVIEEADVRCVGAVEASSGASGCGVGVFGLGEDCIRVTGTVNVVAVCACQVLEAGSVWARHSLAHYFGEGCTVKFY